jgi:hypothetical protein
MRQPAWVLFLVLLLGCGSSGAPAGGQNDAGDSGAPSPMDGAPPSDTPSAADTPAANDVPPAADTPPAEAPAADGGGADVGSALDAAHEGGLPPGLKAIMITNPPPNMPTPGDVVMRDRLRALGFVVTLVSDAAVTTAEAAAQDLVVISSSAESAPLNTKVRDVTIPVVSVENGEYPMMRMTGAVRGTDFDMTAGQTSIVIKMPDHPLAAGLTGTVKIASMVGDLGWGVPAATAIVIATAADNPAHAAIFAYEKGAMMVGMNAPARRVGYAIREALAANLTAEGGKLFDAVVTWAMGK